MKVLNELEQLAACLDGRDLNTSLTHNKLVVTDPISAKLHETIVRAGRSYLTDWGYEVGQVSDEQGTSDRIAFLLGVPSRAEASS